MPENVSAPFPQKGILGVITPVSDLILKANVNYQFSILFPVTCLSLGPLFHHYYPPKTSEPGVKTWMQIVYFVGDSRKQEWGSRESKTRKEEELLIECVTKVITVGLRDQHTQGTPANPAKCFQNCPLESWSIYSLAPVLYWTGKKEGRYNSLLHNFLKNLRLLPKINMQKMLRKVLEKYSQNIHHTYV